ncbi:hypothetical protein SASPL_110516 [Salvia splendens]|uniref:YdbS-like PH domain-containing protein n=1 Tax=Salvia splendens TaxID=180675 RepID=A0A8X8Y7V5_SALSN|nr:hypothetical protein SASPL_110516 [Salvia splendens]
MINSDKFYYCKPKHVVSIIYKSPLLLINGKPNYQYKETPVKAQISVLGWAALHVSSSEATAAATTKKKEESIFFDGGAHYGDLVANLVLGFTLVWLPLSLAAVFRAFFLRYRFTDVRVTVISGLTGQDRSDFSYEVVKDVQVVPRFIGEWGDVIITLKDGTKVDLRSVPKFREIAKYCLKLDLRPNSIATNLPKTNSNSTLGNKPVT